MSTRSKAFGLHHRCLEVQDAGDRIPCGCERDFTWDVWQGSDVPNDQGRVQHRHGNHHRDN